MLYTETHHPLASNDINVSSYGAFVEIITFKKDSEKRDWKIYKIKAFNVNVTKHIILGLQIAG